MPTSYNQAECLSSYRDGPTTASEAQRTMRMAKPQARAAVNPSTQHIPTSVILSVSSCSVVCGWWLYVVVGGGWWWWLVGDGDGWWVVVARLPKEF